MKLKRFVLIVGLMFAAPIILTFVTIFLKLSVPCVWPMNHIAVLMDGRPSCPTFNKNIKSSQVVKDAIWLGAIFIARFEDISETQRRSHFPIFIPKYLPPPYTHNLFAGSANENLFNYEFYKPNHPLLEFTIQASPYAGKSEGYFEKMCKDEGTFQKGDLFPFGACLRRYNRSLAWLQDKETYISLKQIGARNLLTADELQKIAISMTSFDSVDF